MYKNSKDKLKLPIVKKPLPSARSLSMDDYLAFVSFNIRHMPNKKAYKNWKRNSAVNVAFVLK